jgi:hypothetical protein
VIINMLSTAWSAPAIGHANKVCDTNGSYC